MTAHLVAIQQVYARYSLSLDGADLATLTTCFTDDCEVSVVGGPSFSGHDGIGTLVAGRTPTSPRHENLNVLLDVDGDRATGRAYFVLRGGDGQPAAMGEYADQLVRDGEEWRFAARQITFTWRA